MTEIEILRFIHDTYGAIIAAAAKLHRHRPEVLAGIMMRETEGGLSRYLDKPGPEGRGDQGHGHGLMQIDDRSFPDFCGGPMWRDPSRNVHFGAWVLSRKRQYLSERVDDELLERATIAAYNCGEGNVSKALAASQDIDARTAHGNYSREVLRFAELYSSLKGEP